LGGTRITTRMWCPAPCATFSSHSPSCIVGHSGIACSPAGAEAIHFSNSRRQKRLQPRRRCGANDSAPMGAVVEQLIHQRRVSENHLRPNIARAPQRAKRFTK
jgi:hypothetical protein